MQALCSFALLVSVGVIPQRTFRELILCDIYRMELAFGFVTITQTVFICRPSYVSPAQQMGEGKTHQKLGDSVLSMTLRFREEIAAGRIVARDVRAADGHFADNLEIAVKSRPLHS